jgi:hypothetical protein
MTLIEISIVFFTFIGFLFTVKCLILNILETVGEDFSLYYLWKYGKKYTNWYNQRETFNEYLKRS